MPQGKWSHAVHQMSLTLTFQTPHRYLRVVGWRDIMCFSLRRCRPVELTRSCFQFGAL